MNLIKIGRDNHVLPAELSFEGYLKVLSNLNTKKDYVRVLLSGIIVTISDEKDISVYYAGNAKSVFNDVKFISVRPNGYVLVGIKEEEVLLLSPKGNFKAKYYYQKERYCKVKTEKENGINCYYSGFMLYNKFFLNYNWVALKCQNKCFLSKINKLDLQDVVCIGIYDDIKTICDNPYGLVYVLYHNGDAKLYDKTLKEIKIDGLKEIIFLENGDFFAVTDWGVYLYDKSAKLIKVLKSVEAKNHARFYKAGDKTFDCMTYKEVLADGEVLLVNGNTEVFYKDEKVSVKETKKKAGLNTLGIRDILFNVKEKPAIVDKKFAVIKSEKNVFVFDLTLSKEEMKHQIFAFVKNLTEQEDLPLEVFDYLKSLCSYLTDKDNMLLKDMFLEKMITL